MKRFYFSMMFTFLLSSSMAVCAGMKNKQESLEACLGKKLPDLFLNNVEFYSKATVKLSDFYGRWLILDLWDKNCSACVQGFPHLNQLQNRFESEIQVLLVADEDREGQIRSMYQKFRARQGLNLPCSFDSSFFRRFHDIDGVPCVIIIDPLGIVRAVVPGSSLLNEENISLFIHGGIPQLESYFYSKNHFPYDYKRPFLTNGVSSNGGVDTFFIFRSMLSQWLPSMAHQFPARLCSPIVPGQFQVLCISIPDLYKWAYIGREYWDDTLYDQLYPHPLLQTKDSSIFNLDYNTGKGLFCYSLTVPLNKFNEKDMMAIMQRDMQNYFGYETRIERRPMVCWDLILEPNARQKLLTKGETSFKSLGRHQGYIAKNVSISKIIKHIMSYNYKEPPMFDKTNIHGNIDIKMDCIMTDINDIRSALKRNGLDLVHSVHEMDVLVISD